MESLNELISLSLTKKRVLKFLGTVLVATHLISCFWVLSAKLDNNGPDTWVFRYDYMNEADGEVYMAAFYWAVTTVTTVGYGDIHAKTMLERLICVLWIFFIV
jgi:hyperpolarization activated cyclic nucleotide-gated potassium channel 1